MDLNLLFDGNACEQLISGLFEAYRQHFMGIAQQTEGKWTLPGGTSTSENFPWALFLSTNQRKYSFWERSSSLPSGTVSRPETRCTDGGSRYSELPLS